MRKNSIKWKRVISGVMVVAMLSGTGTAAFAEETLSAGTIKLSTPLADGVYEENVSVENATVDEQGNSVSYVATVGVCVSKGAIEGIYSVPNGNEHDSYMEAAAEGVKNQILSATSAAIKVDAVSGATYSSKAVVNAVKKTITKASVTAPKPSVSINGKGMKIVWKKCKNADSFVVYRNGKVVAKTMKTTFVDKKANKNGKKYSYIVAAVNNNEEKIKSSKVVGMYLSKVTINHLLHGGKGTRSFILAWNANDKCDGYQIQYGVNKKFKNAKKTYAKGKDSILAIVKGLNPGKTYYIRLRCYKKIGGKTLYSAWSSSKSQFIRYY